MKLLLVLVSLLSATLALARNSNEAGTCAATAGTVNCTPMNVEGLTVLDINAVLTDLGSAAATFKLQKNNAPIDATADWFDIANSTLTWGSDDLSWAIDAAGFRQIRVVMIVSAGSASAVVRLNGKGK